MFLVFLCPCVFSQTMVSSYNYNINIVSEVVGGVERSAERLHERGVVAFGAVAHVVEDAPLVFGSAILVGGASAFAVPFVAELLSGVELLEVRRDNLVQLLVE